MSDFKQLSSDVEALYKEIADGKKKIDQLSSQEISWIEHTVASLDQGSLRVSEKVDGQWIVHQWVKKGILLFFRLRKIVEMNAGDLRFLDKIPLKNFSLDQGVRVVPSAIARYGSFIEPGVILMPSYVNIGARVGSGSMVDTWATVGSCAQIGKGVHLSGGVGIGGVLEPIQANPVIVEDHAFIGSRCIVVEGALIEEGAVLGAGVTITGSTKIIDVTSSEAKTYTGLVPANSVVIPGTYQKKYPAGEFGVPCALIIGKRKPSTDLKTSLTEALRDFNVSV